MHEKFFIAGLVAAAGIGGFFIFNQHPRTISIIKSHPTSIATLTPKTTPTSTSPVATGTATTPSSIFTDNPDRTSTISFDTQPLDKAAYDAKILSIANLPVVKKTVKTTSTIPGSTTIITVAHTVTSTAITGWPVKTAPYPNDGALLPFNRIVAYYGNLYSKQMGVLGEYPRDQMLAMLASTTAAWSAADPSTPVVPAIDYIAVAAQGGAGSDGKYRLEMPDGQIDQILSMAQQIHGIVFLDIQVGLSTVQNEVPKFEKYLSMSNVELSLDPEFDMHNGARPGTVIGTMNAADINFAANYLANLVNQYHLPPKILVVHRFTDAMVTNYQNIKPLPEVQFVMDMDGFGSPSRKLSTYRDVIIPEPVQFTGFKLFYRNDAAGPDGHLMAPEEVLKLSPQPSYIQYQ